MSAIAEAAAVAPTGPGVYFLLDDRRELLYIGKAANLRARLRQHAKAAATGATPRDELRGRLVTDVRWEPCPSEAAAVAREADLIVALRPLLNAAHTTEGRWVYVCVDADTGSGTCRLRLVETVELAAGRAYGCFPHLGVGVSSRPAIACSEGYASLIRLIWAAGTADPRAHHPRVIAGPSPPRDVALPFDPRLASGLHRLLSGSSRQLLDLLLARVQDRPAHTLPALRRDHEAADGFFRHGPSALRSLRLRHRLPPGPISRPIIETLLAAEVRAAIGGFELPRLGYPDPSLVGARLSRAYATRSQRQAHDPQLDAEA